MTAILKQGDPLKILFGASIMQIKTIHMRKTKMQTFSLILTVFIISMLMNIAEAKTINLVTVEWMPHYGPSMKDGGIVIDISTEAFKKVGYDLKVDYKPWKRALIEGAEGEKYHGVLGAYYSEERNKKFLYSDATTDTSTVFFKRKGDNITYKTLKDLTPYKVGVMRGSAHSEEFDSATFLQKDVILNQHGNIQKLFKKRVDLIVGSRKVILYEINTNLPEFTGKIEIMGPPLQTHYLHIIISRKVPEFEQIIKDFNLGLKKIKENGTYDNLLKKHGF